MNLSPVVKSKQERIDEALEALSSIYELCSAPVKGVPITNPNTSWQILRTLVEDVDKERNGLGLWPEFNKSEFMKLYRENSWLRSRLDSSKLRINGLCSGINSMRTALSLLWDKIDDYPFYNKHGTWCTACDLLDSTASINNMAVSLLKAAEDAQPAPKEKKDVRQSST